jgi:glycosyltransferase involved in cell wall biosynthesis
MIEAMACGTPVLAMPGGSVAEIVCEGISGHVCSTVAALSRSVRDLKLDPETVRSYVMRFFSAERMAKDYIRLYDELAGEQADSEVEGLAA